jgi:adenylyltransferase/sulfurtransferase
MFGRKESSDQPIAIDVVELKKRLDQSSDDLVVLDCREPDERMIAKIEPSIFIPMRETPDRIGELDDFREQNIVVYCHGGVRSLKVTQFLRQQGFAKAQNLTGGIDAWSRQIDPRVPRY